MMVKKYVLFLGNMMSKEFLGRNPVPMNDHFLVLA